MPTTDDKIELVIPIVIVIILSCVGVSLFVQYVPIPMTTPLEKPNKTVTVMFFYGEECSHCHAIAPMINNTTQKYPEVELITYEVWHDPINAALFEDANVKLNISGESVPEVVVGNVVLVGDIKITDDLETTIQDQIDGIM